MGKIVKYSVIMLILSIVLIYASQTINDNEDLGNGYTYIYESDCIVGKYDIPSYIEKCWYNDQYIIAIQSSKGHIIDPIFNVEDIKFSQGLNGSYYWIIDKKMDIRYGGLSKERFNKMIDSLIIKFDKNWNYINSKEE